MDRKSIIALVACFAALMLWNQFVFKKLYPPIPLPARATNSVAGAWNGTNHPASSPNTPPSLVEAPPARPASLAPLKAVTSTDRPEELLDLTNNNARYTFTSYGGGLKRVELLRYPETVSTRREGKTPQARRVATLNDLAPIPTLALADGEALQGDGVFTLTRTPRGVRAEKELTNGLVITKDFEPGTNYLVEASLRIENRSAKPLDLPEQDWVVGLAAPLGPRDLGRAVGALWYNGSKSEDLGGGTYFSSGGCTRRVAPDEYRGGSNVVWVAVHNQFFALAAMPQQPAGGLVVRRLDLPRPTGEDAKLVSSTAPLPQGYEAALVFPATNLAPKQALERTIRLYTGPKEYQTLARLADRFNNNIDLVMGFGWASMISKALLLSMNWLHDSLSFAYGWAIIAITVIIKAVFWPLTRASTRSMKRMQALQPQMKAIQEKFKDDPVKMNRKTMEFMREHKVSPLGGCLPTLIQIPVFIGMPTMEDVAPVTDCQFE